MRHNARMSECKTPRRWGTCTREIHLWGPLQGLPHLAGHSASDQSSHTCSWNHISSEKVSLTFLTGSPVGTCWVQHMDHILPLTLATTLWEPGGNLGVGRLGWQEHLVNQSSEKPHCLYPPQVAQLPGALKHSHPGCRPHPNLPLTGQWLGLRADGSHGKRCLVGRG